MNRRERRQMQKELGLNKFYKNQTNEQRSERIRDNIENGKRMMEDRKEQDRIQQNMTSEEKESQAISILAQKIAMKKAIPMIEAMDEAQLQYNESKK